MPPREAGPVSVRPNPICCVRLIDAELVRVISAFDLLVQKVLPGVTANVLESRHTIDNIHGEAESVDVVVDGQLKRSTDASLLLIATHMKVIVIRAAIGQVVDQLRIAVEVEDDRLVDCEERIEIGVGESVGMLGIWLQLEEVDYIDEADF